MIRESAFKRAVNENGCVHFIAMSLVALYLESLLTKELLQLFYSLK